VESVKPSQISRKWRKLEKSLRSGRACFRSGVYMFYVRQQNGEWIVKVNLNFADGKEISVGEMTFKSYDELVGGLNKLEIDKVF
jgi:hypothetical protein